eukprot:6081097-Amphidinium_carterae.1
MRGALWKVNRQCVRAQDQEEVRASEITDRFLHHLKLDMSQGRVTKRMNQCKMQQEEHGSAVVEAPVLVQGTADAGGSEEPMQSQRES